jgi:hypothetical protein
LIVLWYLLFQRLSDNHTLHHVVVDALNGGADRLSPRGKRLSLRLRSQATTSYSDARQRVPLTLLQRTLCHTGVATQNPFQGERFRGLKPGAMDGSTVRLRPLGDIPQSFSPHRSSQRKRLPYWCLARVVGIFCLSSGVVMDCVMASPKQGEQTLSAWLFKQLWAGWLLVADRNFGVYSVVCAGRAAQAHLLVRLTQCRAASLARRAGLTLHLGLNASLVWNPTRHDQLPAGVQPASVPGRLVAIKVARQGFRPQTLYLFTTLTDETVTAQELARLYARRWAVELYFRYLKTQMNLDFLNCQSAEMAQKEWWAGLIAYNLIRWTMAAAAATHGVAIEVLSFSQARQFVLAWLIRYGDRQPTTSSWSRLIRQIAQAQLPRRKKKRPSEPRAIRTFRTEVPTLYGSRPQARQKLAAANLKS